MSNDETQQSPNLLQEPERGIGERIRQRRKELDLTVEELAALTAKYDYASGKGVSAPTLYRYERDGNLPGAKELRILCWTLNVDANWLLLGQEWNQGIADDAKLADAFRALMTLYQGEKPFGDPMEKRRDEQREKIRQVKLDKAGREKGP